MVDIKEGKGVANLFCGDYIQPLRIDVTLSLTRPLLLERLLRPTRLSMPRGGHAVAVPGAERCCPSIKVFFGSVHIKE